MSDVADEEAEAMDGYFAWREREDRIHWWKCLWMLISTTKRGDYSGWSWYGAWLKLLCIAAVLLHRVKTDDRMSDRHDMGHWDYATLYAGWEAWCVNFDPKAFRYEIFSDGDWSM